MKTIHSLAISLAGAALLSIAPHAASGATAGSLNPNFGQGGVTLTPLGNYGNASGRALSIDPANGDIVVAGVVVENGINDFAVARYTPAGALDPAFASSGHSNAPGPGTVLTQVGSGGTPTGAVAQANGKILVCGYANGDFALVRYLPTGALDPSFGNGGIVLTPVGPYDDASASAIAVQPNGDIVLAGVAETEGGPMFAVVRYTPGGALDNTFGSGGIAYICVGNEGSSEAYNIALQPNGDIVLVGEAANDGDTDFAIVRLKPSGALDNSFGSGGEVLEDFSVAGYSVAYGVALQTNGDIVVGGQSDYNYSGNFEFTLARFTPSGVLDSSFGIGGIVLTNADLNGPSGGYNSIVAVAIQPNGDIVAAGYGNYSYGAAFAVARYTPKGLTDNTFGNGGVTLTEIDDYGETFAGGVALQGNGNIVLAGEAYIYPYGLEFAVADYLGAASSNSQ